MSYSTKLKTRLTTLQNWDYDAVHSIKMYRRQLDSIERDLAGADQEKVAGLVSRLQEIASRAEKRFPRAAAEFYDPGDDRHPDDIVE